MGKAKLKWPKVNSYELHIPIYEQGVWLFTSNESWDQALRFMGLDDGGGICNGKATCLSFEGGEMTYLIGVFNGGLGTLVHEISHISLLLFENLGMEPESGNGEPFSYLSGYLFDNLRDKVEV